MGAYQVRRSTHPSGKTFERFPVRCRLCRLYSQRSKDLVCNRRSNRRRQRGWPEELLRAIHSKNHQDPEIGPTKKPGLVCSIIFKVGYPSNVTFVMQQLITEDKPRFSEAWSVLAAFFSAPCWVFVVKFLTLWREKCQFSSRRVLYLTQSSLQRSFET